MLKRATHNSSQKLCWVHTPSTVPKNEDSYWLWTLVDPGNRFLCNFYTIFMVRFFSQRVTELESTVLWCWGTQKIGHQKKSPWKFLPEAHPKVQICFQVKKFPDRNAEITLRFWVLLMFSMGALLTRLTQFPHDLRRFWSWYLGSRTFVVCSNRNRCQTVENGGW